MAGLIELMNILRSKDGCAWDNEQTHQSLIEYLLEESFEFAEAVESEVIRASPTKAAVPGFC